MALGTPTNTWANLLKYAGTSDDRQIRFIMDFANLIDADMFPFCRLLGGIAPGMDGKTENVKGIITSSKVTALKPEVYDYEVAPTSFRLTADVGSAAVGNSISLVLDTNAGLNVNDVINKVDQNLQGVISALTGTNTVTLTVSSGDGSDWLSDPSVAYIEKLGNTQIDGYQVGVGNNREPTNRYNYLQFGVIPMSQGILQKNLSLYADHGDDWAREKKQKLVDVMRGREGTFIAGRRAEISSAANRKYTSNGLEGWAGTVFNNDGDGSLSYDTFARALMPKARAAGGSMKVYGLCGNDVAATFSNFQEVKLRPNIANEKYGTNVKILECPGGELHLLVSEFMNKDARRGQMITFQPKYLRRAYLQNLDLHLVPNLNLGNELADRAAYLWCECLMASNPNSICIHTNILR